MATPSEVAGDKSAGETARSGNQDPIPLGFVADSLSQAPRSSHGQDVEVGGGFAGSRRAPSSALRVGLPRSNSGRGLPGGRGLEADGRGPGAGGRGPGAGGRASGGAGVGGRGLGLSGMAIGGMGACNMEEHERIDPAACGYGRATPVKDIPGSGKFQKKPLQNTDSLQEMFGDISNDESDHWNPMTSNPIISKSQPEINYTQEDREHEQGNPFFDWSYKEDEEEITWSRRRKFKRCKSNGGSEVPKH